jgi:hypothetical protein
MHALIVAVGFMTAAAPALACSLSVGTGGTLSLNGDGTILASDVGLGLPATASVLLPLLSGANVYVSAPTRTQSPGGYNGASELIEVRYTASGLLSPPVVQPYTASATVFPISSSLSALTVSIVMHNRIVNPAGFAAGSYGMRTTLTCAP